MPNLDRETKLGLALGALSHLGRALTLGLARRSAAQDAEAGRRPARKGGCPGCGGRKPEGCPHCGGHGPGR